MSLPRCPILLVVLSVAACGAEQSPEKSDLALPVTAPMQAREQLLRDIKGNQDAARRRADELDSLMDRDR